MEMLDTYGSSDSNATDDDDETSVAPQVRTILIKKVGVEVLTMPRLTCGGKNGRTQCKNSQTQVQEAWTGLLRQGRK
jgi:hypothetical protein